VHQFLFLDLLFAIFKYQVGVFGSAIKCPQQITREIPQPILKMAARQAIAAEPDSWFRDGTLSRNIDNISTIS